MLFKGPAQRCIHRFGYRFESDRDGMLEIDINSIKAKSTTLDENGNEITFLEKLSDEDKKELLSALTGYGFIDTEKKIETKIDTEKK